MSTRDQQLQAFLDRSPFARFLGVKFETDGEFALLQDGKCAGMAQVYLASDLQRPPKPINLTIDYLRSAKGEDLYAQAVVHKLGRRMASVRAEAWQGDKDKPVTALQAHFLVAEDG